MAEGESRLGLLAPVVVLLLALLAVWVVVFDREGRRDGGDATVPVVSTTPTSAELAEVWRTPDVATGPRGEPAVTALWPGEAALTRVTSSGVTGFAPLDGRRLWQTTPPPAAAGGGPCAASEQVNSRGVGAVLYRSGAGGGCSVLALIDPRRGGAPLWWVDLGDPARPAAAGEVAVAVGEEAVTVTLDAAGSPDGFHRVALDDGQPLPPLAPPLEESECPDGPEPSAGWETRSVRHAGSRVVTLGGCADQPTDQPTDPSAELTMSVYDADSGDLAWTLPAGFACTGMLAGNPVLLFEGEDEARQLVAFDENGAELWRLPVGGHPGELAPTLAHDPTGLGGDASAVIADEVLVARVSPSSAADERPVFAGYALADGERLWTSRLPAGTGMLGVDDNGLPLLGRATDDRLRLTWLDPADGAELAAGSVPLSAGRATNRALIAYDTHQLYVMTEAPAAGGSDTSRLRLRAFQR